MPAATAEEAGGGGRRRTLRAARVAATDAPVAEEHPPPPAGAGDDGPQPEPAPQEPRSRTGRIRALFDEQVSQSREEAEHDAAMELRQFMEPARQQLLLNVPGSSSPEEAEAMLADQAAAVFNQPVDTHPDTVVDLRNPPSMGAYPPAEKLSNRVLRLADRHWAKGKPRSSTEIVAEKSAIAEAEFARKPAGTQRCLALRGSLRCRGVFVYQAEDQSGDGSVIACPSCGAAHRWDPDEATWVLGPDIALGERTKRSALSSGA